MTEQILQLIEQIRTFEADSTNTLPQNAFFLNDTQVLCCERETGESRHPYYADGLVVWAYSSGQITACESTLHIFKSSNSTEDPNLNFFGGLPFEDGWFPVALQNANRQLFEPFAVSRYVVYAPKHAYYLAVTDDVVFAVRLHVSRDKHIHLAFAAVNTSDTPQTVYLASCIEPRLLTWEEENFWDRMRFCSERTENGYLLHADSNWLVIRQQTSGGEVLAASHSAGRSSFLGKNGRGFTNAVPLRTGTLLHEHPAANTADMAVAADMVHYRLQAGEAVRCEFDLSYYTCKEEALAASALEVSTAAVDRTLYPEERNDLAALDGMSIRFDDYNGIDPALFTRFLRHVQKQVSFCALGKNYAGPLIGVRDVMQQLEVSLMWQPHESRDKLVTAMNYVLESGRPPRQFSVPTDPDALPMMDLRRFIDQGVWVIDAFYTYLCFTDDWSILDEPCSYYVPSADNSYIVGKSDCCDSVLCHLLRIMDYLGSKLDPETGCLRALHGDWNDALDGLGKSADPAHPYGSGVSVMASLQFYRNCAQMDEILTHVGGCEDKRAQYLTYEQTLKNSLLTYAVDTDKNGNKRIVHGWGDNRAYRIGSFCDPDGVARRSTTATAFWAISGMLAHTPEMRDSLANDLLAMRSRYGLKTFDVPFARDTFPYVGRLATITPGTYENAAAYVHASLFGVAALFCLGKSDAAWEELTRSVVLTHPDCTKTPFVMPNSYCDSDAYCLQGESMGDWYTGSGAVLVKNIVRYGFGIVPTLDGLKIAPAKTMPFKNASVALTVKGHPLTVIYENRGQGTRTVTVDGMEQITAHDPLTDIDLFFLHTSTLSDGMTVRITD
ncbi:MAG: hypothetical protein E7553_04295 [Ruminococcaceae bacterium]|nr:hypothetical protein [Oscillospiraceae bacterium]